VQQNLEGRPKSLNDIIVLRMLNIDYMFFFLGMNAQKTPDGMGLADPTQYLFLMKDMQVKSEFRLHHQVLFLDKYCYQDKKLLISLGYDE
jgi:hypothetical protein